MERRRRVEQKKTTDGVADERRFCCGILVRRRRRRRRPRPGGLATLHPVLDEGEMRWVEFKEQLRKAAEVTPSQSASLLTLWKMSSQVVRLDVVLALEVTSV